MGRRSCDPSGGAGDAGALLTLLLLDTTVLVHRERSSLDLDDLIDDNDEPAIAAITVAELGVGVELSSGRRRTARGGRSSRISSRRSRCCPTTSRWPGATRSFSLPL